MNPLSFYEHKPELVQSAVAATAATTVWRALDAPRGRAGVAALAVLAWAAVGIFDYFLYAFGYQLAGLTIQQTSVLHSVEEWLRAPLVVIATVAVVSAPRR